tara:strand:- start:2467 stop:3087 length:621 start_codon:yes stop_codon:yes gene_type:complete
MINKELLIFDFDGVICDSVNIKTQAFIELYKNYGSKIQDQVREYHLLNSGISRFEKFKYFQSVLLEQKFVEKDINILAKKFSNLVKEKVINSPYINGALEFLTKNSSKRQFVCTGTPQLEIVEIAKKRGIINLFENLYGSPKSKIEIIHDILRQTNVEKNNCVFFGDAMTDYNASFKCNIPFIGIRNSETNFPKGTVIIENFNEII